MEAIYGQHSSNAISECNVYVGAFCASFGDSESGLHSTTTGRQYSCRNFTMGSMIYVPVGKRSPYIKASSVSCRGCLRCAEQCTGPLLANRVFASAAERRIALAAADEGSRTGEGARSRQYYVYNQTVNDQNDSSVPKVRAVNQAESKLRVELKTIRASPIDK